MVDAMTKSELIERLANQNPRVTAREVDETVKAVLDAMTAEWPAAVLSKSVGLVVLR